MVEWRVQKLMATPPMLIDTIFLDIDDTLFDRAAAQPLGLRAVVDTFPSLLGQVPWDHLFAQFMESDRVSTIEYDRGMRIADVRLLRMRLLLESVGQDPSHAAELVEAYVGAYPGVQAPMPGAVDVSRRLAERVRLGIISNGYGDIQRRKLAALGIGGLFGCIAISEEIGARKPDPSIFAHAAAESGVLPERALHVGDSFPADVMGAHEAGLHACWYNPAGKPLPDGVGAPHAQVQHLGQLLNLV